MVQLAPLIYFLSTTPHTYTLELFLAEWARQLLPSVRFIPYEDLARRRRFKTGAYIFGDLERLSGAHRELAREFWNELGKAGSGIRRLNQPGHTLDRLGLLQMLGASGQNDFTAFRLVDLNSVPRFPVFIRRNSKHNGSLTPLLKTEDELHQASDQMLQLAAREGFDPADLLVVEFCDTSDADGLYRKYAAFRIGDRIIPRHIFFSHGWVQKEDDQVTEDQLSETVDFVQSNPHEAQIRTIFEQAGIGYGRMDYGVRDGRVQVWEINTNPFLVPTYANTFGYGVWRSPVPGEMMFLEPVLVSLRSAFVALLDAYPSDRSIDVGLSRELRHRAVADRPRQLRQAVDRPIPMPRLTTSIYYRTPVALRRAIGARLLRRIGANPIPVNPRGGVGGQRG